MTTGLHPENLSLALVHYPIINREGRLVTTAITNFDIHDIARAACTYGVARYFLVTPSELQREFARRIISHWVEGWGAEYNPSRQEALQNVEPLPDLVAVGDAIERDVGSQPYWIATSAKRYGHAIDIETCRARIAEGPVCLVFGTGSGLHSDILADVDAILSPIIGPTPYNHLSVRSAVSIYLDRLFGA